MGMDILINVLLIQVVHRVSLVDQNVIKPLAALKQRNAVSQNRLVKKVKLKLANGRVKMIKK